MDCHDNHRYHPYAPADGPHERYVGREWYRRDHVPFPSGHRGARNGRYSSGRRGTGSQRLAGREEMYRPPPDHGSVRPVERHLDSRYERPERRISPPWYQGRSMHYGPPRPPFGNNRVHYRAAGYSPHPRVHPKSMRPASSHPTGQVNVSVATSPPPTKNPMGSPHYSNNMTAKATDSSCSSEKTNASLSQRQTHTTSTSVCEPLSLDKQQASLDSKNPSIAKVEPFSHQPLASCAKSSSSVCTPSLPGKISTDTNIQVKAEDQMVSLCNSLPTDLITRINNSELSTPSHQCHAAQDGLMTIYAANGGGELRPIITTICSCQLRQRALKYVDKGKTKDDSIVLDSDDEEEKEDIVPVDSIINQEQTLQSSTTVKDKTTAVGESSCQETPRKRAKMSIEKTPEKRFFPGDNAADSATAVVETDSSSSVTCSESEAETVSRIVDGLQQNLGEGCSSSTSSDSLSSLSSANIIEDAPLLANPQILQRILDEYNEPGRPFKKFKVSPRNLYAAAKECNIHKVLAVLAGGCDPNLQVVQAKGKTAMHAAAGGGYVDIIACLRLAGCDLNLVDYDNRTPVFDAVKNHKFKAVEYLIECGANLGMRDTKGMTCFHVAVRQGHTDLIKLLLKTGQFDINEKDHGGWTPIMWAAEDKQFDATQLLIEQGANVHIRDLELNVPLHWAAYSGNLEVCQLLLDEHTHINTVNIHLETPLHIAAREEHYQCVQLFLSRGADIHIKNKDGCTPLELADPESRGYYLLKGKAELESHQAHVRPRILHSDISRGQENVSISCINEVDDEPFPEFTFIKECCEVDKGMINWSITKLEGCQCGRICRSGKSCRCSKRSEQQKIWYNKKGMLKGDIQEFDRPLIFECNRMCGCWSNCKNRVVQKGMQYPLQLYRTLRKGWGVRSLADIPQGSFVCEYTGELIPDSEADDRDDDSYLFDLDCKESTRELFCIDAKNYGNISRFINHSCEPNIFPLRVFIDHRDIRFPRIAFFATKDIHLHEEICFNYGDRFWSVKRKEFYCECGTASCKYRSPNC